MRPLSPSAGGHETRLRDQGGIGGAEDMAVGARVKITLACTECKRRNYDTVKNKKNDPDRLEMNKHCPFCRKHTPHREGR